MPDDDAPRLLALTTATDPCGVAVRHGDRLLAECTLHRPRQHGRHLVPLVRSALAHAEVPRDALDAVALAAGPGSYTGLRIGASTAKGLCRATGAALAPVSTLAALAEAARPFVPPGTLVGATLRSRRGEVYVAAFVLEEAASSLERVAEAAACSSEEAAERLHALRREHGGRALWLVGSGAGRVAEAWASNAPASNRERAAPHTVKDVAPTARAVAHLGATRLAAGTAADAASFEPCYLKPVHATPRRESAFEGLS